MPDLHRFRRVISQLCATEATDVRTAVLVPSGGAARQLRATIGRVPDNLEVVTRDEWYDAMARGLPDPPPQATSLERDSLVQASATAAAEATPGLSFQLRPGLAVEILRFYDTLRRQGQQVRRFEELMTEAIDPAASAGDRGAGRLLLQTQFLARTFSGYETRLTDSGLADEHALRALLAVTPPARPLSRLVITVADWIADPAGLYPADFDLVSRAPGLERIDIVCTEGTLASGFHQRLRDWLPGLQEIDAQDVVGDCASPKPLLVVPAGETECQWHTMRDRAEELSATARRIKADRREGRVVPLDRVAIVYRNPLPYLYLARETLGAAGIPWRSSDAMPLAAEPTAAAVDLVLDLVETSFTRDSIVSLLRSPHFALGTGGTPVPLTSVAALDRALSKARYLGGGLHVLEALGLDRRAPAAADALQVSMSVMRELAALAEPAHASEHFELLKSFLTRYFKPLDDGDPFAIRERRARAAILDLLDRLIDAHARHHDPQWTVDDVASTVRRWIAGQTFTPEEAVSGIQLLDDQAARYGDFDDLSIVGLTEDEWPERTRRNIFYPANLLKALGWPTERERRAADDARFMDLVTSASSRVALSTYTLENETLVARSVQLDELSRARLSTVPDSAPPARIYADDVLTAERPGLDRLPEDLRAWAALRLTRPPSDLPEFHGYVGAFEPKAWSVSALETYLGCPFRFFAQHVLALEEEPEDEQMMDPRRQGLLVHDVFETFFREWQRSGHGNITPGNLEAARELFATVVDEKLAGISDAEAGLERTRLLGSPAAAGLGEAVFRMEAERPVTVVERLLEHRLEGAFVMALPDGSRTVRLRGKADRIDLLEDGTFRLIDYKLGWPPNRSRALQLPIYGLCAEQRLTGYRGRAWMLGEAAYLAFKGPRRVVPLFSNSDRQRMLEEARVRLVSTIDAIERGEFPPQPDDVFRCETCSYAPVCRKDYVGDTA